MKNQDNIDSKYNYIIENISSADIKIPEDYDEKVNHTLNKLKQKPMAIKILSKAVAGFVLVLVATILLMFISKDFAVIASNFPGFNIIADWIYEDSGIQHAHDEGYPTIEQLTFEQDGYRIALSNIIIDEDRISFNSLVIGEGFEHKEGTEDVVVQVDSDEERAYEELNKNNYGYQFSIEECQHSISYYPIDSEFGEAKNIDIFFANRNYDELELDYIKSLINTTSPLNFDCIIQKGDKVIATINISIPVNENNVLLSKRYNINDMIYTPQGEIELKEVKISPTRMTLKTISKPFSDITSIQLDECYLKDGYGNVYNPEGFISSGDGTDVMNYYFVPSIYFNNDITKLYLCYDKYRCTYPSDTFYISKNQKKTIDYYGNKIIISDLENKNGNVSINIKFKNNDYFSLQGVSLIDEDVTSESWSDYEEDGFNIQHKTFDDIEVKEGYEFELEYPYIYKDMSGEVLIYEIE